MRLSAIFFVVRTRGGWLNCSDAVNPWHGTFPNGCTHFEARGDAERVARTRSDAEVVRVAGLYEYDEPEHADAGPPLTFYYTLADFHGELLLGSEEDIDWPAAVRKAEDAVRMDWADTPELAGQRPHLDDLLARLRRDHPDLRRVHAARYFHVGTRSQTPEQ